MVQRACPTLARTPRAYTYLLAPADGQVRPDLGPSTVADGGVRAGWGEHRDFAVKRPLPAGVHIQCNSSNTSPPSVDGPALGRVPFLSPVGRRCHLPGPDSPSVGFHSAVAPAICN